MKKLRPFILLLTIIVVSLGGYSVSMYARGYRINPKTLRFNPSGLLVAKSDPDGAQIMINGELKGATNSNLSLPPGTYDIAVKKEGYIPWNKRVVVEKEVVTEINASLFRLAPSLSAVTFSGAVGPIPSPDFSKIAFVVPATATNIAADKEGLWLIETINLPLGFSRDPRRITDGDLKDAVWTFSPDGRQILLNLGQANYLLESSAFTPQGKRVNISNRIKEIQKDWQTEAENKFKSQIRGLPDQLVEILKNRTEKWLFSPDESKIMYLVKSEAVLKDNLIKPIPGASTQPQERNLLSGRVYVYDTKEDRNFYLGSVEDNPVEGCSANLSAIALSCQTTLSWFPTSRHILIAEGNSVSITDYDGTNKQRVYSGSYSAPFAFPIISADRILILTNLGSTTSEANLYSLTLK